MINGNPGDFLDHVYSGQDTIFAYNSIKYWCQGYADDSGGAWRIEIFQYQPPANDDSWFWECSAATVDLCYEAFLNAKIFNGKTFWEAESEIEWLDE